MILDIIPVETPVNSILRDVKCNTCLLAMCHTKAGQWEAYRPWKHGRGGVGGMSQVPFRAWPISFQGRLIVIATGLICLFVDHYFDHGCLGKQPAD